MTEAQNTLLIEGSFRELAEELADYVDSLSQSKTQLRSELNPLLEACTTAEETQDTDKIEEARDEVLRPLVKDSGILNNSPEKEFIAAYNLLIHLLKQSSDINEFLPTVCKNLASADFSNASSNRFGLALSILSTIFNVLDSDDSTRFPVFSAVLDVISRSANYESLRPQLKNLGIWIKQWETPQQQQRRLYLRISSMAQEAGELQESQEYYIKALRTFPPAETANEDAQKMSVEAIKMALNSPTQYDFEDVSSLSAVQHLSQSSPTHFQLLQIFTQDTLQDYIDFKDEHKGWIEQNGFDDAALTRKIRLLTLTSLASAANKDRSLPYSSISAGLQIPAEDVEMWVIDVIRAGLVEGKLSQLNQTFLIHRGTYRVFSENQWREVAGRLSMWKDSLVTVLEVLRQQKEEHIAQREMDLKAIDAKMNGYSGGGRRNQMQRDTLDVGLD